MPFVQGIFLPQSDDKYGQLWIIEDKYPKPPFESSHLDAPAYNRKLLRLKLFGPPP